MAERPGRRSEPASRCGGRSREYGQPARAVDPVGTWPLDPATAAVQRFPLPAPRARYVQFSVPALGRTASVEFPDVLRVLERAQDSDYSSALAEYGEYRREAFYELSAIGSVPTAPAASHGQPDP